MFRKQNLCPVGINAFDLRKKHFLVFEQQNLFLQHMFPARLNWETFASATIFPSLAWPLRLCREHLVSTRQLEAGEGQCVSVRHSYTLGRTRGEQAAGPKT